MRIAVTGGSGMLGTAVVDYFSNRYPVFATSRRVGLEKPDVIWNMFDITNIKYLHEWLMCARPDVLIHCAAMVNIAQCEKQQDVAYSLHVETTKVIAEVLSNWHGKLIYISTDMVFDGFLKRPYMEDDVVNPINIYGVTKRGGERIALASPNACVLRTNIFGWTRIEHMSFAEWLLKGLLQKDRLIMFDDVLYSPIHVSHLAILVEKVITKNLTGLFHAGGNQVLSKYDFAVAMANEFNLDISSIIASSIDDIELDVPRPKNMALDNSMLKRALGKDYYGVKEGLALFKEQYLNGWLEKIKGRPVQSDYKFWCV